MLNWAISRPVTGETFNHRFWPLDRGRIDITNTAYIEFLLHTQNGMRQCHLFTKTENWMTQQPNCYIYDLPLSTAKQVSTAIPIHFFFLVCVAAGLLCQPRVIVKMVVEKQIECRLAGETEDLGENLPHRHFCPSQNPTWRDPGLNPGRRDGKPATNRLSYGAAHQYTLSLWPAALTTAKK
jgi:hypothetical protein